MNWTEDVPLFTVNPDSEEILYGAIYGLLAFFQIPLYVIVMLTLYQKDRKQKNMTYKLMNVINLFEVGGATGHLISSPILFFPMLQIKFDKVVRIFACTLNTFWLAELPLMTILAVSRILVFCEIIKHDKMHFSVKIAIGLVLSWTSFVLITSCITGNMTFYPPVWGYDHEVPSAAVFEVLEMYVSLPSLGISYIAYIIIIEEIYRRKKKTSSVTSRKNEIAILLQYTFVNTSMVILIILFHHGDIWFDVNNPRYLATINSSWISWSYLSPGLLLVFNKPIREDCFSLLGFVPATRETSKVVFSSRSITTT